MSVYYIFFAIIVIIFFVVFCRIVEVLLIYVRLGLKSKFLEKITDWFLWVERGPFFVILAILIILLTPLFFEFRSNPFTKKEYSLHIPFDDKKPVYIKKMGWFGNRENFGERVLCFKTPNTSPWFTTDRKFVIHDSTESKEVSLRIALFGDYPSFIQEVNSVFPDPARNTVNGEDVLFGQLTWVLKGVECTVQELPEKVEEVSNHWLEKKGIRSVKIKLLDSFEVKNPNRRVSVE